MDVLDGRTENIDVENLPKEKHKDETDGHEEQKLARGIEHGFTGFGIEVAASVQGL